MRLFNCYSYETLLNGHILVKEENLVGIVKSMIRFESIYSDFFLKGSFVCEGLSNDTQD